MYRNNDDFETTRVISSEIDSYTILSPDEINNMFYELKTNITKEREAYLKDKLFKTYVRLVRKISWKFYLTNSHSNPKTGIKLLYDDIFQEGCLALVSAINSYNDKKRSVKFNMYLHFELKSAFSDYLQDNITKFKIPSNTLMYVNILTKTKEQLAKEKLPLSFENIKRVFEEKTNSIITLDKYLSLNRLVFVCDIDKSTNEEVSSSVSFKDFLKAKDNTEKEFISKEHVEYISNVLSNLDPRILRAMMATIEKRKDKEFELKSIAENLNLTKERLSLIVDIKIKALKNDDRLREAFLEHVYTL